MFRFIFFVLLSIVIQVQIHTVESQTWQTGSGTSAVYLTIQDGHFFQQFADGSLYGSARVIAENQELVLYTLGKPNGNRLVQTSHDLTMVPEKGERNVYIPCPHPPETVGWKPYSLPVSATDPVKRKKIAGELVRRFEKEQTLRREENQLTKGRMDEKTMALPAVQKKWEEISATDEDNRQWLEKTLRTEGWIGRKSHGDKAHEALILITLHNIHFLRLSATILAQLRIEQQRGDIGESSVANVADRFALVVGDPLEYGIQATADRDGKVIIPVIADQKILDANRARIGQPSIAEAARRGRKILRIDANGRLLGEGLANAKGLDTVDFARALREPTWGLTAVAEADPVLGAAIAAKRSASMAAWTRKASKSDQSAITDLLLAQGRIPGSTQPNYDAIVDLQELIDGVITGLPVKDDARIMLSNQLAYALVARKTSPSKGDIVHAAALAEILEKAVLRTEVIQSGMAEGFLDTIACIRFYQGDRKQAATLWKKIITQTGKDAPEIYKKRLAVAEGGDSKAILPLE